MLAPRRRWPSASRAHASSPRAVCALRQTVHTVHPDTTAPNQQSAKAAAELQTKLYNAIFWLALITLLHVRHAPPSPWPCATRRMLAPTRRATDPTDSFADVSHANALSADAGRPGLRRP